VSWHDIWPKRRNGAKQTRPLTDAERDYAATVRKNKAAATKAARDERAAETEALKERNKKIISDNEKRLARQAVLTRKRRRKQRRRGIARRRPACDIAPDCGRNRA
jgi:hypothetical protein